MSVITKFAKLIYQKIVPRKVRKSIWKIITVFQDYVDNMYIHNYRKKIPFLEKQLKNKDEIQVVFFAMNISMWKYDGLYRLMQKHPRFNPIVLIAPDMALSPSERIIETNNMSCYFKNKDYAYIEAYNSQNDTWFDVKKNINPDLLFYTQPNSYCITQEYFFKNFPDKLFCYVPYGFSVIENNWTYNLLFHNLLWKFFSPTIYDKGNAQKYSRIKAANVIVTGYPMADLYLNVDRQVADVWKVQDKSIKRIIWAPHHSVYPDGLLHFSNFLEIYNLMYNIAQKYNNKIQVAFKPHPMLKKVLYNHSGWGKLRTDVYYDMWKTLPNGQLVEGDYVDLFLSSDAMIHECASFTVEYLYTLHPVMFFSKENHEKNLSTFGCEAYNVHYKCSGVKDIENFIENVVLKNNDPLMKQRKCFFDKYLLPPNGKLASQNMLDEILRYTKPI